MDQLTITSPTTGDTITVCGGDGDHGIWVTVNSDNARTFITATELVRMARNNATWDLITR